MSVSYYPLLLMSGAGEGLQVVDGIRFNFGFEQSHVGACLMDDLLKQVDGVLLTFEMADFHQLDELVVTKETVIADFAGDEHIGMLSNGVGN